MFTFLLLIQHTKAYKIFGGKNLSDPRILLWDDAEIYCRNTCNSHLASIHSNQTFKEIVNLANIYWDNDGYGDYMWFGLNDRDGYYNYTDGTAWDYGTTKNAYPWQPNQPNSNSQRCIAIYKSTLQWGDAWCPPHWRADFAPFVCDGDCIITLNPTTGNPTANPTTNIPSTTPSNAPTVITFNPTSVQTSRSMVTNSTNLQPTSLNPTTASPTGTPISITTNPTTASPTISAPMNSTIMRSTAAPANKLLDGTEPFTIALTFICLIISIMILYDFITGMKWNQWERKRIKYLGGSCLLMYSLSLLFAGVSHTSYLVNSNIEKFIGLYEFQLFFWGIGKCLTYIVFIERLYYLFENTAYQSNKKVARILYISIFILGIAHIQFMLFSAAYYQNRLSSNTFIIYRDIQVIVNCLVDGLISIALFYLFISKLFKVSQNIYVRSHQNLMVTAERVDEYNAIFFNSTIRLTVLSLLPVFVTLINFILETVLAFNSKSYVHGYNIWLWSSTSIYLYLLDTMSCIICVYMTFSIENAKLMYSKCCKRCDKMCRSVAHKRYENSTQMTKVTDNYFELTDDESDYSLA